MVLTDRQREIVSHPAKRICVRAGPGTGKTTVLTYRIAHLVADRSVQPERICALTFARNAAAEMRARLEKLLPLPKRQGLEIRTFHSFAYSILRYAGFFVPEVLSGGRQLRILKEVASSLDMEPRQLLRAISRAKNMLMTPCDLRDKAPETAQAWEEYEKRKKALGCLDYDDLLLLALSVLKEDGAELRDRFTHVLVDEFQDLSPVQYQLLQHLTKDGAEVFAVGDPLQCIYEWRASVPSLMDTFCEDFQAELLDLCENFRSRPQIIDFANRVMDLIDPARPKLVSNLSGDGKVTIEPISDKLEEAQKIASLVSNAPKESVGILVRKNAQMDIIEQLLEQGGIQVLREYSLRSRPEAKVVIELLKLILDPEGHPQTLEKYASLFDPYLGRQFREELRQISSRFDISPYKALDANFSRPYLTVGARRLKKLIEHLHQLSKTLPPARVMSELRSLVKLDEALEKRMWPQEAEEAYEVAEILDKLQARAEAFSQIEDFLASMEAQKTSSVSLMTIHRAKGMEFKRVLVPGLQDGTFPASDSLEEWRLFFVAVTRAREELVLLCPGRPEGCQFLTALREGQAQVQKAKESRKGLLERLLQLLGIRSN